MTERTGQAYINLLKPSAILIVVVVIMVAWPFYRKFFINEWRERIGDSQPVVFIPDCPTISVHFKCGDRNTIVFRRNENNQWCTRVRKNEGPEGSESCGLDIDAWDFARSWRYFSVEGVRLYYSWRGRVIISPNQVAGWLVTPENLAARAAHPLSVE
jgi:hypothetical protein